MQVAAASISIGAHQQCHNRCTIMPTAKGARRRNAGTTVHESLSTNQMNVSNLKILSCPDFIGVEGLQQEHFQAILGLGAITGGILHEQGLLGVVD